LRGFPKNLHQDEQEEFVIRNQPSGARMAWMARLLFRDPAAKPEPAAVEQLPRSEQIRLARLLLD
jgi:hypothetical protein